MMMAIKPSAGAAGAAEFALPGAAEGGAEGGDFTTIMAAMAAPAEDGAAPAGATDAAALQMMAMLAGGAVTRPVETVDAGKIDATAAEATDEQDGDGAPDPTLEPPVLASAPILAIATPVPATPTPASATLGTSDVSAAAATPLPAAPGAVQLGVATAPIDTLDTMPTAPTVDLALTAPATAGPSAPALPAADIAIPAPDAPGTVRVALPAGPPELEVASPDLTAALARLGLPGLVPGFARVAKAGGADKATPAATAITTPETKPPATNFLVASILSMLPESLHAAVLGQSAPAEAVAAATGASAAALDAGHQVIEQQLDLAHEGEWLDQLARDIARSAGTEGALRFKLNPENLGSLQVEMSQTGAGAAIRMTADTETARAIIADAQPKLVAEARAQGLRIAETHVDLAGHGQQPSADARRQGDPQQQRFLRTAADEQPETITTIARPRNAAERYA